MQNCPGLLCSRGAGEVARDNRVALGHLAAASPGETAAVVQPQGRVHRLLCGENTEGSSLRFRL